MDSTHRLSVIATALLFSVSLAGGQEGLDPSVLAGKIANWPAPTYWSPPEQAVSPQEREGGVRTEGVSASSTSPLPFIGVNPCRLVDTRQAGFPVGYGPPSLVGGLPRDFDLDSDPLCPGIPVSVGAYSLNITVTNTQGPGFILIYPQGSPQPPVSTLNYVAGQTIANAAVVPAGAFGGVTVIAGVSGTDLIIDINGYYAPAGVGNSNTFVGLNAGNFTMSGDFNTGFGESALVSNTTGSFNTATGSGALLKNTTGIGNTASGSSALGNNTMGGGNTANGAFALFQNTTGGNNTADGNGALSNTTGFSNIGIGRDGGINLTTGSNNICIGNPGGAGESNTIRVGTAGTQTATFIAGINGAVVTGVPVQVSSSGQLGVALSSRYVKEDIREIAGESDGLMRLRPVAFRYKPQLDPMGLAQYGLIAEEVANVYPDLVVYDREGRPETVRYHLVNALLLNEVQKQHRTAEAQERTIAAQEKAIERQKETIDHEPAEIEVLKVRLGRLEAAARLLADSRP